LITLLLYHTLCLLSRGFRKIFSLFFLSSTTTAQSTLRTSVVSLLTEVSAISHSLLTYILYHKSGDLSRGFSKVSEKFFRATPSDLSEKVERWTHL
jgi:hypothetical protein